MAAIRMELSWGMGSFPIVCGRKTFGFVPALTNSMGTLPAIHVNVT